MNTKHRSVARVGLVVCSLLAVVLTGCRTHVVREHTRTVYVPAPPPPPVVISAPPAPAPQAPPPVVVVSPPEQPPVVVIQSENDFYEPLAVHGRWVAVGSYGRCWIPARVEVGWRPYANGYWQRTDEGWYWASEEPWGWATYHYGRWDFHAEFGWIWVPQMQWAPAWVAWREGGGYVGWAPLRPSVAIGVSIGTVDYEPAYASRAFVFVEHRRMLEPVRPKTVVVNNTTIINQTVNITNVKVVNKTVINEGPRPEVIERESGRKVQAVAAREFRRREEATVAARERNIPTTTVRKAERPVRKDPLAVQPPAVTPRNVQVVERAPVVAKPTEAVTQPARPSVVSTRPTPAWIEEAKPARVERNREIKNPKKDFPASVEPRAKPEVRSEQAVLSRREVRSVDKPGVAAKPIPQVVTTHPIRSETKREATIEKRNTATPGPVEPKARYEVRPGTSGEAKAPAKIETALPSSVGIREARTSEKPADKRLIAPGGKSRAAEQPEANKKKQEDKGPKQKVEDQETPAVVSTRPSR